MDVDICSRAHQTRERQEKLASVSQRLDFHYAHLAAATSNPDSALYGRDYRAQNQSESHLRIY